MATQLADDIDLCCVLRRCERQRPHVSDMWTVTASVSLGCFATLPLKGCL
jgi:hypothetical protein